MNVRQYNITIKCMLAILLSALFASCKDEDEEYKELSSGKNGEIGFNAFQDGFQKPTTRAVIDNVGDINEIYVLSMKKKGNSSWEQVFKNGAGADIDVLTLSNSGTSVWNYSPEENWEDGYNYKFRAYYPNTFNTSAGESCANGFQHSAISSGSTVLTLNNYRSATDPRNNSDILVSTEVARAYSTTLGNDDPVPLNMKHLLACVDFKIKKKEGASLTINSLKIRQYASEASYDGSKWIPYFDFTSSDMTSNFDFYKNDGTPIKKNYGQLKKGEFYVEYKDNNTSLSYSAELSDNSKNPIAATTTLVDDYCTGLLMIPQTLKSNDETINLKVGNKTIEGTISRKIEAVIEFYFDNNSSTPLFATVDLTANGKIEEWKAGTKYTYTIGVYEYQVNANIDIEDWTHHTFEGELK